MSQPLTLSASRTPNPDGSGYSENPWFDKLTTSGWLERCSISRQPPEPVIPITGRVDVALLSHAETPLDIGRPASDIYAYLADFSRQVEWAHTYLAVEALAAGPLRVGSQLVIREKQDLHWDKGAYTIIADRAGPTYATHVEVAALEPARRIAWRTRYEGGPLDGVRGEWAFVLEPVDDAITVVRFRAAWLGPESTLAAFGLELLRQGCPVDVLARQVDRAMHNIRTILEGRAESVIPRPQAEESATPSTDSSLRSE